MTALETAGFAVLWIAVGILFLLVLLLYRQVEKAYRQSYASAPAESLVGADVPAIDVLGAGGEVESVDWKDGRWSVAIFVSTSCSTCQDLLTEISDSPPDGVDALAVFVTGDSTADFRGPHEVYWLSHPADVVRDYGVTVYPMVFVLKGRRVAAVRSVATVKAVRKLIREAREDDTASGSVHQIEGPPRSGAHADAT